MRRLQAAVAGGLAITGAVAWACAAGAILRVDRTHVAAGGELEVTITVVGTPNPPPMAIRLDRLDAPPVLTLAPNGAGPTVVRVQVPEATAAGQHILIANDE